MGTDSETKCKTRRGKQKKLRRWGHKLHVTEGGKEAMLGVGKGKR